jgi:hypothetical protein
VTALLEVNAGHDGQINRSSKVDKIGVGLIFDIHLLIFLSFLAFIRALIRFPFILTVTSLTQDLSLQLLIGLLMLFPLRIELEYVEALLNVDFVIKSGTMSNLVLFLDKIKFFFDCRVILVAILSDLEQHLNHILDSLVNICLVKDISELIKYGHGDWPTHLLQMLSDLPRKAYRYLHTVVGGFMQQKQ